MGLGHLREALSKDQQIRRLEQQGITEQRGETQVEESPLRGKEERSCEEWSREMRTDPEPHIQRREKRKGKAERVRKRKKEF